MKFHNTNFIPEEWWCSRKASKPFHQRNCRASPWYGLASGQRLLAAARLSLKTVPQPAESWPRLPSTTEVCYCFQDVRKEKEVDQPQMQPVVWPGRFKGCCLHVLARGWRTADGTSQFIIKNPCMTWPCDLCHHVPCISLYIGWSAGCCKHRFLSIFFHNPTSWKSLSKQLRHLRLLPPESDHQGSHRFCLVALTCWNLKIWRKSSDSLFFPMFCACWVIHLFHCHPCSPFTYEDHFWGTCTVRQPTPAPRLAAYLHCPRRSTGFDGPACVP